MGRPRSFDTDEVLDRAQDVFRSRGYHGSSVDDLLSATGLFRASLYHAFGSKRGLMLAVLTRIRDAAALTDLDLDLLLVALVDLAPADREAREVTAGVLARHLPGDPARALGQRLLARLGPHPEPADPPAVVGRTP